MSLSAPGSGPAAFNVSCFERKDNAHAIRTTTPTYLDDEGNPLASTTERYRETREAQSVVEWTSLGSGTNPAPGVARDRLLVNNANAANFHTFAAMPGANAILIWLLRHKGEKAGGQQEKDDLMEGLCGVLQCARPIPHPPQEYEPKLRNPDFGPSRVFLMSQLSDEHFAEITLSTYYCVRLSSDRVVSFGAVPWDIPPCRYIGTLRDVDGIEYTDKRVQEMVIQATRNHITSRQETIHRFVGSNRTHWWGGAQAIPHQTFLADRLVPQITIQPLDQPAQPEVQRSAMFRLNIFAPGVFSDDRGNLWEGWRDAILGPANGKVNLMLCNGTIAQKDWHCTYCLQVSHPVRLCPIMYHPSWFDGARDALEEEDSKLAEAFRKTKNERAQHEADALARRVASCGGRGRGRGGRGGGYGAPRGGRGGGRGGHSQQYLPYGRA